MRTALLSTAIVLATATFGASSVEAGCHGGGIKYIHKTPTYRVKKVYVHRPVVVAPTYKCINPYYRVCVILPGDTWQTVALRCYGNANLWHHIAQFNGLSTAASLVPGQQLQLPAIHPNGLLTAPTAFAPAPAGAAQPGQFPGQAGFPSQGFPGQQPGQAPQQGAPQFAPGQQPQNGTPAGQPNGQPAGQPSQVAQAANQAPSSPAAPAAPTTPELEVNAAPSLPSIAAGSTITLDGRVLGDEQGTIRLMMNGLAMPLEIVEWSTARARVKIPEFEMTSSVKADIEIRRADGSLAGKAGLMLSPSSERLALGN